MIATIFGTKQNMEQTFTKTGARVPITVVKSQPNVVVQIKTNDKDGYQAIQLGIGTKKFKNIKKPQLGHLKEVSKDNKAPLFLREVRTEEDLQPGQIIQTSDVIKPGDLVSVQGISKGKGFAGAVKRWGFSGGPKTHGQSDRQRAPGSIGQGTTPGRVLKGKKMAGHMGFATVSVSNLTVLKVDSETGEIWLSGLVPGNRGSLLRINKTGEKRNFIGLHDQAPEEIKEEQAMTPEEIVEEDTQNIEESQKAPIEEQNASQE